MKPCPRANPPSNLAKVVFFKPKTAGPRLPLPGLTCWELQASVDGHSRSLALQDVHGELQTACVGVAAIGEGEAHFVGPSVDSIWCVDQQPVQDVLVGEGGTLREDTSVLQWLRVELPSTQFA